MKSLQTLTEEFQRRMLAEALSEVTPIQLEFFNKIFPDGVKTKDLYNAYDLVMRTLAKNEKGR